MKILKIKDTEVSIPTSWMDINLKMYLQIQELDTRKEDLGKLEFSMYLISTITGLEREFIQELSIEDFTKLSHELEEFKKTDVESINQDFVWENDGKFYAIDKNVSKWSFGQFIDMEQLLKEGDVYKNGNKISAFLLRESTNHNGLWFRIKKSFKKGYGTSIKSSELKLKAYDFEESNKKFDLFLNKLPVPVILSCIGFFLSLEEKLLTISQNYTHV